MPKLIVPFLLLAYNVTLAIAKTKAGNLVHTSELLKKVMEKFQLTKAMMKTRCQHL